ncbi:MAG: uroporphyrinogen decarboxylase family protein [Eubacteriales bacterium]|nr:uroporphyrinogen decarboxylase family protein [Eubacteriales bacterium]
MTSRERLLTVMRGEIPDRVPISTYEVVGYNSAVFYNKEPSYRSLMDYIREKTDCMCLHYMPTNCFFTQTAVRPDCKVERVQRPDGYETHLTVNLPGRTLHKVDRVINGVHTTWNVEPLCKSIEDVDALLDIPYEPVTYDPSDMPRLREEVGEHGLLVTSPADPACAAMQLMEFGESLVWAMTEPEHFEKTVRIFHERMMQNLERQLNTYTVDMYRICGPEYLTPPYLPPEYFAKYTAPYLKEMVDLIHSHGAYARIHCHGKIGQVLDMMAATGCDAIDPCEAPPDGDIEFADIKRCVGDRIVLMGNIQLKLLEKGSAEEVREYVLRTMDACKPGGRFVIMPTAGPINVPLSPKTEENYRVFIDTALEAGVY